ncbi:Phage protein [Lactococcus lactis subsp. lactis KF147]|nr:Phage protein [Lactococcus lactis subsp. lactis KF147]
MRTRKMTKFEEEFKALTSWDWINIDLIQQILTRFGNWHSDGEFQELLSKYSGLNHNYEKEVIRSSKLESQIANLKSQLQQQALPVVPECVAEWYEGCAPIPVETCITDFLFNYQKEKSVDDGTEFEQWFIRTDNSIEILMDMKRLGYEVEKP